MGDALYFSHDYNSRNDIELLKLKYNLGHEGKSIFWDIVEMLYENEGYLFLADIPVFARTLETSTDLINKMVNDYNLFKKDDTKFWSETALKRLKIRMDKSKKARESIGKRWSKNDEDDALYECNTNIIQSNNESNTIKGKGKGKGKEKGKVQREENAIAENTNFCTDKPHLFELKTNKNTLDSEIFPIDDKYYGDCVKLYPAVDVNEQFFKMTKWLEEHPEKRKTYSGMNKFINNWLEAEQNKGGSNANNPSNNKQNGNYPNSKSVVTTSNIKASRSKFIESIHVSNGIAEQSRGIIS